MQIPYIPIYSTQQSSGCSLKYHNFYFTKRTYTPRDDYGTIMVPIMSVFDFVVISPYCKITNWPLDHSLQHLLIGDSIDFNSFYSLN